MRRIGGFAVFALLAVAGCTTSADGSRTTIPVGPSLTATLPRTSASPRPPTPSVPADVPTTGPNTRPGEKPPVMPVAATKHTRAGAKAFAVFFIKTIDWGFATLNGSYIRHFSLAACTGCATFADGMDRDRKAGHRYIGGRIAIAAARVDALSPPIAVVRFAEAAYTEVDRLGHLVSADGAHHGERFDVHLRWRRSWQVFRIDVAL
jgi:hypothetical protein